MCRVKLLTNESAGAKHDCCSCAGNKQTHFIPGTSHVLALDKSSCGEGKAMSCNCGGKVTSATHFFFPLVPSCHPTAARARLCLRPTPSSPSPALLAAVLISGTAKNTVAL